MDDSRRCAAKSKQSGERCKRAAIVGGTTCKLHGSGTRAAREAAQRNVEAQEVQARMVTLGIPVDVDPTTALLEEVRHTAGHVAWLRAEVQALDPDLLTWGKAQHEEGIGPEGPIDKTTHKAAAPVVYELYMRERKHLAEVAALALRAGVQERQIALAEAQALQIVGVYQRALASITLTPEQQTQAREAITRELRALDQNPGA